MPVYILTVCQSVSSTIRVEADSPEEAALRVSCGEGLWQEPITGEAEIVAVRPIECFSLIDA